MSFFEVWIASLLAQHASNGTPEEHPSLHAALERTAVECHQIVKRQYAVLNDEILPQLSARGIHLLRHQERNAAQRAWVNPTSNTACGPAQRKLADGKRLRQSAIACFAPTLHARCLQRQRHHMQNQSDQAADHGAVDAYVLQVPADVELEFLRYGFSIPVADDAID